MCLGKLPEQQHEILRRKNWIAACIGSVVLGNGGLILGSHLSTILSLQPVIEWLLRIVVLVSPVLVLLSFVAFLLRSRAILVIGVLGIVFGLSVSAVIVYAVNVGDKNLVLYVNAGGAIGCVCVCMLLYLNKTKTKRIPFQFSIGVLFTLLTAIALSIALFRVIAA